MEEPQMKHINEENYKKGKEFFTKLGKIFGIIAGVLLIVGIIIIAINSKNATATNLPSSASDAQEWFNSNASAMSGRFWGFVIIGLAVTMGALSAGMFIVAHKRELMEYNASTVLPVAAEGVEYMAEPVGKVIDKVAEPIVNAVNKTKNQSNQTPVEKLRELNGLYKDGIITKEEYEEKKKSLIDQL